MTREETRSGHFTSYLVPISSRGEMARCSSVVERPLMEGYIVGSIHHGGHIMSIHASAIAPQRV